MDWIHNYQLFLFDFDGVLVNSEEVHYQAYQRMCAKRGFSLKWDRQRYMQAALYQADGLEKAIYGECPALREIPWPVLYEEKKLAYKELLLEKPVELMPGVAQLLEALQKADIPRAVVTNSRIAETEKIRQMQPLLNSIPYWICREHYKNPKPDPEGYLTAIAKLGPAEKIIGFEDSPRGLRALVGTPAKAVLVSSVLAPHEIAKLAEECDFAHISSFEEAP
ncbi:MAG: HAD family hydrolase [Chlamydiales bacterium]